MVMYEVHSNIVRCLETEHFVQQEKDSYIRRASLPDYI